MFVMQQRSTEVSTGTRLCGVGGGAGGGGGASGGGAHDDDSDDYQNDDCDYHHDGVECGRYCSQKRLF